MNKFRPLLAATLESMEEVQLPVIVSPKIDGIRCLCTEAGPVTRKLLPIKNDHIREMLVRQRNLLGVDGEIVTYTDGVMDDYNTVQSKVMSRDGEPNFRYHLFDIFLEPSHPFRMRLNALHNRATNWLDTDTIEVVYQVEIRSLEHLEQYEAEQVSMGWEGIIIRDPEGEYKYGRSTLNEGIMLKVKRFTDDEGVIVGMRELMHNTNEAQTSELGLTKRSHSREGMVPAGTLGALTVAWRDVEFDLGTGLDDTTRASLWRRRRSLRGKSVTFKFQGVGTNGRPRFPSFRGIREDV